MGAWGTGPFDNDGALDLVSDLSRAQQADVERLLTAALTLTEDYVESPEASAAVAAAALVAARAGWPAPGTVPADVLRSTPDSSPQLRALARSALDRVVGTRSEWRELWEQVGLLGEATAHLDGIRNNLEDGWPQPRAAHGEGAADR